jgi:biopolymer transport protein ExbB/TolQ
LKYETFVRGFHGFLLNTFFVISIIIGISFILFGILFQGYVSILIGALIISVIIIFKKKIKKMSERKLDEDIKESKNKKWYEKAEFEFDFGSFGFSFVPIIFINLVRSINSFISTKKSQKQLKQNYQTIHSSIKEFSPYTNIKYSIIVQFPKFWKKKDLNAESDNLIALVKFQNPKNKNVLMIIFIYKDKFQTFEEFLSSKIIELKKQDIIFLTNSNFSDKEVNTDDMYQIIYKEQESEEIKENYQYLIRYIYSENRIYEFFCQSDIPSFDSNLPLFEKIMDTIQISK